MTSFFSELSSYRYVLAQLISQNLTLRYRRTAVGFLWTLINPLLMIAVSAVVFSLVLRVGLKDYAIFLFSAIIPWNFLNGCIQAGGSSLIANEGLLKKIYVPKQIFPVAASASLLVDSILSTVSLFVIVFALGAKVTTALFFLPVAFLLTGILGISLALIFSIVCVYLRDTSHIITIVMQAVYYMTPIIYPISLVPKQYHIYFQVNPLVYFIGLFRAPIYEGRLPDLHTIGICVVTLCVTSLIGLALFQRFAKTLIFRL
ncbi:ABC transporter permease [Caballeronia sordidicola]|uniref:ABC transporter permease n=1 Tax=Caballeronia sordidicola TaxID=196367 RepID=UPI000B793C4B|nr:ABC transporter permease [Caballeronia sordidicola]